MKRKVISTLFLLGTILLFSAAGGNGSVKPDWPIECAPVCGAR